MLHYTNDKLNKLMIFLFVICASHLAVFGQNPNPSTTLDATIQNEMLNRNFPGVATIIVKDGEIVWVESYGYADVSNTVAVEDTTVFLLASVSKLFTGTAAMQLYEAGIIDLDADINQKLPWEVEIPNFINDSITIRQLMTHTSSIRDNWSTMNTYYGYPDPTISLANCMERYFSTTGLDYDATGNFLNSPPGTTYQYSNMASALNGYIVEVSTGSPFDNYCDDYIFDPLCMKYTAWHFADFDPDQVAIPYSYQNGNYIPYDQYGFADYPDGQLRSTILDLGNFMIAYLNGGTLGINTILTPTTVNEMFSLQIPLLDTVQGLNWYRTKLYHNGEETMLWGHNGGEKGVSTNLYLDPQNNIGICVLANGEGDGLYICDALYEHALNMTVNNSIVPNCLPITNVTEPNIQKEEIIIYPNPARDFVRVETNLEEEEQYRIYTSAGKMVSSGFIDAQNKQINLSDLPRGLYFIELQNNFTSLRILD
ncbi:MAG: serine hydrolase [Saprospiraceae bacterium]|nr:serine hydrolase [Saprospiraceae bacterium]